MSPRAQPPRHQRSRPPWLPLLIALLVIAGLFVVGFFVGTTLGLLPGQVAIPPVPSPPPTAHGAGGPDAGNSELVTERTVLEFLQTYSECGCTTRESRLSGLELAGLTPGQLGEAFPDFHLQSFSAAHALLTRIVQGLCPDMETYRTLGIRDGRVAVFFGRPGTGLMLQRITNISISDLTAADHERLATGIVLLGDFAVDHFLEGLPD
jgi:hypothetical protein